MAVAMQQSARTMQCTLCGGAQCDIMYSSQARVTGSPICVLPPY
jgi:hypothetical protein